MNIVNAKFSGVDVVDMTTATKSAQVAAIRRRLGDIAAGANGFGIHDGSNTKMAISWAIMDLFRVPVDYTKCGDLDSLAVWLWERGVRA